MSVCVCVCSALWNFSSILVLVPHVVGTEQEKGRFCFNPRLYSPFPQYVFSFPPRLFFHQLPSKVSYRRRPARAELILFSVGSNKMDLNFLFCFYYFGELASFRRIFNFPFSSLMRDENQYPPSFDPINKVKTIIYSDSSFKWLFFFTDHSRRGFCDKVGREIHLLFPFLFFWKYSFIKIQMANDHQWIHFFIRRRIKNGRDCWFPAISFSILSFLLGATGRLACSFLPLRQYSVRVCWPKATTWYIFNTFTDACRQDRLCAEQDNRAHKSEEWSFSFFIFPRTNLFRLSDSWTRLRWPKTRAGQNKKETGPGKRDTENVATRIE
jgi:hypothetical protein